MFDSPAVFRQHLLLPGALGTVICADALADFQREWFAALDPAMLAVSRGEKPPIGKFWIEATKGCGKDSMLAVELLWLTAFSRRMLFCQVAAVDSDQADELRKIAKEILKENEWLSAVIEIQAGKIVNKKTESAVEIIASDTAGSHGARPDVLLVNELAHIAKTEFVENLLDNSAKCPHGIVLVASNAGFKESWAWKFREACRTSALWRFFKYDRPAPWISEADLADRRRVSSLTRFNRLWHGIWGSNSGDAFDEQDLLATVTRTGPLTRHDRGFRFCAGLDLGISHDHCALAVLDSCYKTQRVGLSNCWSFKPPKDAKVDLMKVEEAVILAHEIYKFEVLYYDPFQCELMAQRLARSSRRIKCEPMNFVGKNLDTMASTAMEVIRGRRFDCYDEPRFLEDMRRLTITEKSYGHRLESTRDAGGHADIATSVVIALPGAVQMAMKPRSSIIVACEGPSSGASEPPPSRGSSLSSDQRLNGHALARRLGGY